MHPYAWTWNEETLVLVPGLAVSYALAVRRVGARAWRVSCFGAAVLLLVAFGISPLHELALRYLLLVHNHDLGEEPERVLLGDPQLMGAVGLWALTAALILVLS